MATGDQCADALRRDDDGDEYSLGAGEFLPVKETVILETAVEANHERHENKGPNRDWLGPNYLTRLVTPSVSASPAPFVLFVYFVVPAAFSRVIGIGLFGSRGFRIFGASGGWWWGRNPETHPEGVGEPGKSSWN